MSACSGNQRINNDVRWCGLNQAGANRFVTMTWSRCTATSGHHEAVVECISSAYTSWFVYWTQLRSNANNHKSLTALPCLCFWSAVGVWENKCACWLLLCRHCADWSLMCSLACTSISSQCTSLHLHPDQLNWFYFGTAVCSNRGRCHCM